MRKRLIAVVAALSAAAIALAGCSSDTASGDSPDNGPTSVDQSAESSAETASSADPGEKPDDDVDNSDDGDDNEDGDDSEDGDRDAETSAVELPEPQEVDVDPGDHVVGYFTDWGIYDRGYFVKNIETSGSAEKLTHILYAFGNVKDGVCKVGDPWADHDKTFTAEESIDGVDGGEADLSGANGNFGELRKLKDMHPGLKVLWSFGGWTWSDGFPEAAADPVKFAESCYDLVLNERWAGTFDGIDIDWEYPNECGASCDEVSGREGYPTLIKALRAKFGPDFLITSAISADGSEGGKLDQANYAEAAKYLNFVMPMTYDYFGPWDRFGPVAPHSPMTVYDGIPNPELTAEQTIEKLTSMGIPAEKLLLGLGFYGRGWVGVDDPAPGSESTIGKARGTYEAGVDDYKVVVEKCPPTGTIGGTAYGYCDGEWWGYDTPETIRAKMDFVREQGLAGTFFWELSGDTADAELLTAIANGLE